MRPSAITLCLILVGCTPMSHPQSDSDVARSSGRTDKEQAAYEQCLQDNMTVSVAWEVIEAQCAASVSSEGDPLERE